MRASALASLVGGRLEGPDREFSGVAPLAEAGPEHAAYSTSVPSPATEAGVLLATEAVAQHTVVVVADPKLAFIVLLRHLFPEVHPVGVQPGAHVHASAVLEPDVTVYPGAYVGPDARIGEGSILFPNAVVMAGSVVGRHCRVGPGAVVGHAGFSLHPTAQGLEPVPQVGRAVLEDGVWLGALTCVDRAFLRETRVGAGSQIDNLVQVGHNCQLGRQVVIAAQTGLSGSVTVGDGAVLGGQVGVADHVTIGPGAQVGAQSGTNHDLGGGRRWMGTPALPLRLAARFFAARKELPKLLRRVRRLEKRLDALARQEGPDDGGPQPLAAR